MEDRTLEVKRSESPIHFLQLPFSQHKYKIISTIAVIIIGLSITALIHYGLRQNFASACFITAAGLVPFAFIVGSLSIYRLITSPRTLEDKKTAEDIEIRPDHKPSLEGKNIEKKQPAVVEDHNYLHGSHVEKEVAEVVLGEEFDPDLESFVEENRNDDNLKPLTHQEKPSLVFQEIEKESDTVQAVFAEENDHVDSGEDVKTPNEEPVLVVEQAEVETPLKQNSEKQPLIHSCLSLTDDLAPFIYDDYLHMREISNLALVNKECNRHTKKSVLKRAIECRYKGNDASEANQYLKNLYDLVKTMKGLFNFLNIPSDLYFEEKIAELLRQLTSSDSEIRKKCQSVLDERLRNFTLNIKERNIHFMEILLLLGANPNSTFYNAIFTAIDNAIFIDKDVKILQMLLEHGAQIQSQDQSALYYVLDYAKKNKLKECRIEVIIQLLCDSKADPSWITRNKTPLHFAAELGYFRIVEIFLRQGAQINQLNEDGETPILAVFSRNQEFLIKEAFFDNEVSSQYPQILTTIEILLKLKADPNIPNSSNRTPLHMAAYIGHLRLVGLFLEYEAQVNLIDDQGRSPLILAIKPSIYFCKNGIQIERVVALLLEKGADPHLQDSDGNTALHYAAKAGYYTIVESLLAHHANIDEVNYQNDTPWSLAYKEGENRVAELLLSRGAQRRFIAYR